MEVLFATGNTHKVEEANQVGKLFDVSFKRVDCPYPEVRDESVSVVAEDGVRYAYAQIGKPVVVEDAGLYIDALNGFPGAFSSFVYRKIGCRGILKLMDGSSERSARFVSAVGYFDGEQLRVFEGVCEGGISVEERGAAGFGYDPVFVPGGHFRTFAEDFNNKNLVSHRKKSVDAFCRFLSAKK